MIRRSIASLAVLASLALPTSALAAEELAFDPVDEFIVKPWFSLKLGPIDMGVSKAVLYLWLASAIAIIGTLLVTRGGLKQRPGRFQTVVETLYAFTETNIGRATLPRGAFTRWFPYVATLFVFIWVLNMISFIPLPLDTHNKLGPIPGLTIYAATSNLSVTLALTRHHAVDRALRGHPGTTAPASTSRAGCPRPAWAESAAPSSRVS